MYQKKMTSAIQRGTEGNMTIFTIASGIAVLAAIIAIIVFKSKDSTGSKLNKSKKAKQKLGSLIEDVRFHVKQNAAGLLQRSGD
jgi:hypothetical protein